MERNAFDSVGIIADDLTSATDGSAPFLARGYAPLILRELNRPGPGRGSGAVVAVDTHSRALSPSAAVAKTASAVGALADRQILFKTIDSTLRGHVRGEIAAAFSASGRKRLVVAPAFPGAGRVTIGGMQWVNGVLVSESDYSRDPVHPAQTSCIADLIDPMLGKPVVIAQGDLEEAAPHVTDASIMILDADSQAALNAQVALISDSEDVLWVGSPGLAIALASIVKAAPNERPENGGSAGRVLIVIGSANPVSHAQGRVLLRAGAAIVTDLADAPGESSVICLHAPLQRREDAADVLQGITEQAAAALTGLDHGVLIATGGETAAAILDRVGIFGFTLVSELEPGFPVGRATRVDGTPLTIALKAGGFGSPETLVRAVAALSHNPGAPGGVVNARQ